MTRHGGLSLFNIFCSLNLIEKFFQAFYLLNWIWIKMNYLIIEFPQRQTWGELFIDKDEKCLEKSLSMIHMCKIQKKFKLWRKKFFVIKFSQHFLWNSMTVTCIFVLLCSISIITWCSCSFTWRKHTDVFMFTGASR